MRALEVGDKIVMARGSPIEILFEVLDINAYKQYNYNEEGESRYAPAIYVEVVYDKANQLRPGIRFCLACSFVNAVHMFELANDL